jgi:hypothetical protein
LVAPVITFRADNESALPSVYDYGTIDTGSSGSNVVWQIWNNYSGSGVSSSASVASAICSGSTNELGLGVHDSGSANHIDQSVLPTGSIWISGSNYIVGVGTTRLTGSYNAMSQAWNYYYSGSSGRRLLLVTENGDGKLSGSADLGGYSGSAWRITHYCYVPNDATQGTKTGAMCLKYKYT